MPIKQVKQLFDTSDDEDFKVLNKLYCLYFVYMFGFLCMFHVRK